MTTLEQEPVADQPNAARLVAGILDDAGKLIGQQAAMLRAEVREDLRRTADAAKYLGFGTALAAAGGLFLAVTLVQLLAWLVPTLPPWAPWAIVGGILLTAGGIAFGVGRNIYGKSNPLPNKTLAALQENVSWITTPRK